MFGETAVYTASRDFRKEHAGQKILIGCETLHGRLFVYEAVAEVSSLDDLLSDVAGLQSLGLDTSKQESWDTLSDLQTVILDLTSQRYHEWGSDDGDDSGTVSPAEIRSRCINLELRERTIPWMVFL